MEDIQQMTPSAENGAGPVDVFEFLQGRVGTVLRAVAPLSDRLLLTVFHTLRHETWEPELTVTSDGAASPLLTRSVRFPLRHDPEWEGRVLLVHFPEGVARDDGLSVQIRSGRRRHTLESTQIDDRVAGVRAVLRQELADLGPDEREGLHAMLAAATEWSPPGSSGRELSRALNLIREALREPQPVAVQSQGEAKGLSVDSILGLDECTFWIKGWCRDSDGEPEKLVAVAPEGGSVDLIPGAHFFDRPDVRAAYGIAQHAPDGPTGFVHMAELSSPSRLATGWLCELHGRDGRAVESRAPDVVTDPTEVRNRILSELAMHAPDADFLARNHVHPAITRLRKRELADARLVASTTYGRPPSEPSVTMIMPLFRRFDLLEYQFASFVHDEAFRTVELLFVLDSPEQRESVEGRMRELHQLYGVPCRLAVTNQNLGLSAACNIAARSARGPLLVFVHSDVVPGQAGWLDTMVRQYEGTDDIGALGPKLVFEDGIIQSAGLFFREADDGTGWEAAHLLRGFHRGFAAASASRPVAAVSSGCLMVARERFEAVGGFRTDFVQGGYEDADLCLRLAEAGYENWFSGTAELYHLEGRSYPANLRSLTGDYNRWLHHQFWGNAMSDIGSRYPVVGNAPTDPSSGSSS